MNVGYVRVSIKGKTWWWHMKKYFGSDVLNKSDEKAATRHFGSTRKKLLL